MMCSIDWAALGQMISGIGTCGGVAALIWATIKGRQSLADWRDQKLLDREIAVAEEALTAAYEVRDGIRATRIRGISGAEQERAQEQLSKGSLTGIYPTIESAAIPQVLLNRMDRSIINKLWDVLPRAKAYFSQDVFNMLAELAQLWRHTEIDIQAMVDFSGVEAVTHKSKFYDTNAGSVIAKVDTAVENLEAALVPKLRPKGA